MDFHAIYREAVEAGLAAGNACVPTPMVVGTAIGFSNQIDRTQPTYLVEDGACGFAWVKFKGGTRWANWAKKNAGARSSYPSGFQISVRDYNQSVARKEAYATAFAAVLRKHGIDAHADSRLD